MALPSNGSISLNRVREELKLSGSISLGQTEVRNLADVNNGRISLNDLKGKSDGPWFKDIVDYYFESLEDFNARCRQIIIDENQGELITKTFGFGDSVTSLVSAFAFNDIMKSTPKAIYANNITNLYQCFLGQNIYNGKDQGVSRISDELFKYCPNVENIGYLFYGTPIDRIPENIFEPFAKKIKRAEYCFYSCNEFVGNVPDIWNKQKYPNVSQHEYYAGNCKQAANYNEIPEGWK